MLLFQRNLKTKILKRIFTKLFTAYLILTNISWMSINLKVEFLSQELVAIRD